MMQTEKVPPIIVDIKLSVPGEYCGGFSPYRGQKREKALEEEHLDLHKKKIRHINLDRSYDAAGNVDL